MTRVLITGGCGFIGSNLTGFLLDRTDWHIAILDNLSTGSIENIEEFLQSNRVEFIEGNLINKREVAKSISKCDFVVNLAAQTSVLDSIDNPYDDHLSNVKGLLNILELSRKNNLNCVIQASSAAAIGEQEVPINEKNIPKPISPYGASKLAGEAYFSAFSGSYGLSTVVLRFSNVYGPKSTEKDSVIAKFIRRILDNQNLTVFGDGRQTRDFIHVDDICKAIYLSLNKNLSGYNLYQIGTEVETSINDLIQFLRTIFLKKNNEFPKVNYSQARSGEILRNFSDISKARDELDFSVEFSLYDGLEDTIEWFLDYY
jgi:UDP-glucose 4-epimerase